MKKILILTFSDVQSDPRVIRQIKALAGHYALSVAGRLWTPSPGMDFIPILPRNRSIFDQVHGAWLLKTRQFEQYYWSLPDIHDACQKLCEKSYDLIIANDVETLPLALRIANGAKILLDAHEYAPREFEDNLRWSFFSQQYTTSFLCKEHLFRVHAIMTVCEGLAREYSLHFNIPRPFIILNTPYRQILKPKPCGKIIRMIHHGKAITSRKLELMIEMMDHLDTRFTLDFMFIEKNLDYLNYLKKKASYNPRIRFRQPVPLLEIPGTLNEYDIGLFLLPPKTFNYLNALPNKFFEFIQARVAIAIGPSPEMSHYVREYDCGIVSKDFTPVQLAAELNQLTCEDVDRFKQNSHRAADVLCFEASEEKLLNKVKDLLTN